MLKNDFGTMVFFCDMDPLQTPPPPQSVKASLILDYFLIQTKDIVARYKDCILIKKVGNLQNFN